LTKIGFVDTSDHMPRAVKKEARKDQLIKFRVSARTKRRAQMHAKILCDGNLSVFLRHAIENFEPKFIKKRGRKK